MHPIIQRLKERKLVQWALAYLAGAWLVVQMVDVFADQFLWPLGLQRGVTAALAVGFFAALVIAWYHGEGGRQRVGGVEVLVLVAVVGVGGVFVSRMARSAGEPAAGQAPELDGASVAVLPFENLSALAENDAFTRGLHDDLITQISRIPDLRVIASTSIRPYEGSTLTALEIARDLGVGTVLTAGVQRSAERIRINVRLLNGATAEQM